MCSSRRESLTTLTPFFLAKSSNLLPFFFLSCIFIFLPNVSYICICQQRRVYHCMNRCVTTIFSAMLLPPDRILKPALPSDSLSYSPDLIASSSVLNEVIMSSTYTCNRIMAIASGWSFLKVKWGAVIERQADRFITSGSLERCNLQPHRKGWYPPSFLAMVTSEKISVRSATRATR